MSGHGTYVGYHVEVRLRDVPGTSREPVNCGGLLVYSDWKRVPISETVCGGFRSELWEWNPHSRQLGLLDYAVAKGIAAQFHAAHRQWNFMFEFRLIQVRVEYKYDLSDAAKGVPFDFNGKFEKEGEQP